MLRRIFILLFVSALTACASTPRVDSLYDEDANFAAYKTFAFAETGSQKSSQYSSLLDKFMKAAITDELLTRGYTKSDKPDLLINYHVSTKEKVDVYDTYHSPSVYYHYRYAYGYAPWPYYSMETRVNQYTEGTLNIDVVDTGKKQLVWEGVAVGRVRDDTLKNLEQRVNDVVKLIFAQYLFRAGQGEPIIIPENE